MQSPSTDPSNESPPENPWDKHRHQLAGVLVRHVFKRAYVGVSLAKVWCVERLEPLPQTLEMHIVLCHMGTVSFRVDSLLESEIDSPARSAKNPERTKLLTPKQPFRLDCDDFVSPVPFLLRSWGTR